MTTDAFKSLSSGGTWTRTSGAALAFAREPIRVRLASARLDSSEITKADFEELVKKKNDTIAKIAKWRTNLEAIRKKLEIGASAPSACIEDLQEGLNKLATMEGYFKGKYTLLETLVEELKTQNADYRRVNEAREAQTSNIEAERKTSASLKEEVNKGRLELANVRLELGNSDASLRIRYAAFTALETERDHYREADKDKAEENIQLKDQIRKLNEEAKPTLAKEVQSLNEVNASAQRERNEENRFTTGKIAEFATEIRELNMRLRNEPEEEDEEIGRRHCRTHSLYEGRAREVDAHYEIDALKAGKDDLHTASAESRTLPEEERQAYEGRIQKFKDASNRRRGIFIGALGITEDAKVATFTTEDEQDLLSQLVEQDRIARQEITRLRKAAHARLETLSLAVNSECGDEAKLLSKLVEQDRASTQELANVKAERDEIKGRADYQITRLKEMIEQCFDELGNSKARYEEVVAQKHDMEERSNVISSDVEAQYDMLLNRIRGIPTPIPPLEYDIRFPLDPPSPPPPPPPLM